MLKTAKEIKAFLALDDETQGKVAPLCATGWKVARAAAHVSRKITGATTIEDLVNRAISEDGHLVHNYEGWEIAIEKVDK